MIERFDAIVVGGGHNGLVAAHYLARDGLSVCVLERRQQVGGMCGPMEFMPGYTASVTHSPGSFEPRILNDMALHRFGLSFDTPDPSLVVPFPSGRLFVAWRDPARVDRMLKTFSAHDANAYRACIAFFESLAERLQVSLFHPPPSFASLAARLRTAQDEADFASVFFGSIRDFLDDRLESEEIKSVLAMLAATIGNVGPSTPGSPLGLLMRPLSLHSSPAQASSDPRRQPLRGSTGLPRGSMASIVLAMRRSLEAIGVSIRTDAAVSRIRVDSAHRVEGVGLEDGREIDAPLVLSNLNPKSTLLELVEAQHVTGQLRERLERVRMNGGSYKLILGLEDVPRFAAADRTHADALSRCQFRIAPDMDWQDQAYEDHRRGRITQCPVIWGLIPSLTSPEVAPPGRHLLAVNLWIAPYRLREGDWHSEGERLATRCIDVMEDYLPGLRDRIVDSRIMTPPDFEAEFGLVGAHQTHGEMTPLRMFSLRPVPGLSDYRTPVKGLYLCGAGVWPGGFVTGLPGHNAADQALRDRAGAPDARGLAVSVRRAGTDAPDS